MTATGENEGRSTNQSKILVPIEFSFGEAPIHAVTSSTGDVWFVAADVCKVLGYRNPRAAVADLDDDEKAVALAETAGGAQETNIINESGVYHLIFRSRKSAAKGFRRWVTSEVLPEIRRTGRYEGRAAIHHEGPETPELALIRRLGSMIDEYIYFHFSLYDEERRRALFAFPPKPERRPEDTRSTRFKDPSHQSFFYGRDLELRRAIETIKLMNDVHLRAPGHMEKLLREVSPGISSLCPGVAVHVAALHRQLL